MTVSPSSDPPSRPAGPAADSTFLPSGPLLEAVGGFLLLLDGALRVVGVHGRPPDGCGAADEVRGADLVGRCAPEFFPGGLLDRGGLLLGRLEAGGERACGSSFFRAAAGPGTAPGEAGTAVPVRVVLAAVPPTSPEAASGDVRYAVELRGAGEGPLEPPFLFHGMATRSAALVRIFRRVADLAEDRGPLLVVGEAGTGREQLARGIHAGSPRRDGPFVAVNCAALPDALAEADLFGTRGPGGGVEGPPPGGLLRAATAGTLYLDGLASLRPGLQRRLLRALRNGGGVGEGAGGGAGGAPRILASADEPWRQLGVDRLEPELARWLQGGDSPRLPLHLPPLRQRPEDVEPLALAFLDRASARDGVRWRLAPDALSLLLRHRWPGNLRELEGALEHACAVGRPPRIEAADLPADLLFEASDPVPEAVRIRARHPPPGRPRLEGGGGVDGGRDGEAAEPGGRAGETGAGETGAGEIDAGEPRAGAGGGGLPEPAVLRRALERHGWRCQEVAERLAVDRTALWCRLRELGWLR